MCRPATCETCKKATWFGCGLHIPSVLDSVPSSERCTCTPTVERDGKTYPPKTGTGVAKKSVFDSIPAVPGEVKIHEPDAAAAARAEKLKAKERYDNRLALATVSFVIVIVSFAIYRKMTEGGDPGVRPRNVAMRNMGAGIFGGMF